MNHTLAAKVACASRQVRTGFRWIRSLSRTLLTAHVLLAAALPTAWAQEESVTTQDVMVIFTTFIVAVIALYIYLARHSILRRRTEYDTGEFESKRNRDYEKYHSGWQDDYEEFGGGRDGGADPEQDHYATLEVSRDSTTEEIKARYRQLAKTHHPDVGGASPSKMAEINRAYEILSDERRRAEYDHRRNE